MIDKKPSNTTGRWVAWIGLLLTIAIISIIDMPGMFWAGDPGIWREETRSILDHHSLAVDPSVVPKAGEPGQEVVQNFRTGKFYSKFGLMNSLMSLPPMWLDKVRHGSREPLDDPSLLICNAWNIILTVLLAAVLMKISGLYADRPATRIIFVLSTFYGTYLWYYLRAQSSEIYQTLFYATAFLLLAQFLRDWKTWRLHLVWLMIAMLVLTRVLYLLLIPLVIVYVVIAAIRQNSLKRFLAHVLLPPILIVALLGWINYVKFGSPFLTGYHVWRPQDHLPTGRLWDGLWGFLFLPRFSIFLYFPLLAFALLQMKNFAKRFPLDAMIAIGTAITFILILSKIPTWAGEWTYGPRYILFALPVLSLPFILLLDQMISQRKLLLPIVVGLSLFYSGYLQFRVNQVGFFAYYRIRQPLELGWDDQIAGYFRDHHVGTVIDDLLRHRDNLDALPWFAEMEKIWSEKSVQEQRNRIGKIIERGNHYWWNKDDNSGE